MSTEQTKMTAATLTERCRVTLSRMRFRTSVLLREVHRAQGYTHDPETFEA